MAPLIVLLGSFAVFYALHRFHVRPLRSPVVALRWALAAMFLLTASAHFSSMRPDLVRMVPPWMPHPELVVTLTGAAEIAGAIGLLVPRAAPWAAGSLALLLVAMFPANVHAALEHVTLGGSPATPLAPRIAEQLVFIAALLAAGFLRDEPSRTTVAPADDRRAAEAR